MLDGRILVEKDELALARELPWYRERSYPYREAVYKDLTSDEILYFQNELRSSRERQKYLDSLSELARYEEAWLLMKADEFERQYEIALVIGDVEPGPMTTAIRSAIRTYDASMAALKRKTGVIDAKERGITNTGSLNTLDHLEELDRYYKKIKYRYERHAEWLRLQIGSFQADLVELSR